MPFTTSAQPATSKASVRRPGRFSETLHAIRERAAQGNVTIGELVELTGPDGHAFLATFFILPFLQPIPLPGISTALGLVVAMLGVLIMLDKPPWVPARLAGIVIEPRNVLRLCQALETLFARLERLIRPRGAQFLAQRSVRYLNGAVWVIHALLMSLPLPIPFSNGLPALVIFLMALGTMEDDIVVISLAWLAVAVNAAFFTGLVALPVLGWKMFVE